jgi:hypothetical protein
MYEAAVVILARVKRASPLKEWALATARRSGLGKARVALARKLSVILHRVASDKMVGIGFGLRWPSVMRPGV